MEEISVLMKVLSFSLLLSSSSSSSDTHSLQYLYTARIKFTAVGLLDGEQFVYYDSNIRKMIPRTEWIKKISADDPDYWNRETEKQLRKQHTFIFYLESVMKSFNQTEDPPTASVFLKHSPSPEVVCHATGFFPKAVNISWRRDREDVNEDVELRETLPNQDGSFQKRSILKVPAEELQKHNYTCVIQHSSLEEELVLPVNITNPDKSKYAGSDAGSGGGVMAIIVGVVLSLVVLVAVVAGIMVWKKKNSGERRKEADVKFSENRYREVSISGDTTRMEGIL
ncbi:hypothetical protein QTP70_014448 [Hemibagrus guttatus]|uniref:Ig-like domain-containing protein n=1 Tax=Hemibagrus guttatus TaxID=175788 RepID=A0AAE0Q5W6_9TELE|nr:hypothetical protein QTP70_014448 [Hemibagrus guttatus]